MEHDILNDPAKCSFCQETATNQALYRKQDGSHFLGQAVCEGHRSMLGQLKYAHGVEIVDYVEVR